MFRTTVFSAFAAAATIAFAAHSYTDQSNTDDAVQAFDAALRGDDTALARVFAEDGVWMPSTGGRFEGHAAIEQALALYPDVTSFEVTFSEETPVGDDLMFHHGTFTATLPPEAGGTAHSGEFIVLSKITPEGLKMIRHIGFAPRGRPAQ